MPVSEETVKRLRDIVDLAEEDRRLHRVALREAGHWLDWCIGEHDAPDCSQEQAALTATRRVLRYISPFPALRSAITALEAPPSQPVEDEVGRALVSFVLSCEEDRQQLPAIQFISNRSDGLARAAIAAMHRPVEIEGLVEALRLAIVWFDEYALMHRAKATAEGNDKGQRNQDRADQLRAALAAHSENSSDQ